MVGLQEFCDEGGGAGASSPQPRWIDGVCPGFRFQPTDQELLVQFLRRKVEGESLPGGMNELIPTIRLCGPGGDPRCLFDNLPAAARHPLVQTPVEFYAFARWEHANAGNCPIRSAGPGTWSSNGAKNIVDAEGRIIGQRALLTFKLKSDKAHPTNWVMHEYTLPHPLGSTRGQLVLCRIRYTKEGSLQLLPKKRGRAILEEGDEAPVSKKGNPSTTQDHHMQISSPSSPGRIESMDDMELPDNFLVTQKMQIPLSYAEDIIGVAGTNIGLVCLNSGATTVTLKESRGLPDEMIVEIKGTTTQVQTAQQLIQELMGGGKEPVEEHCCDYGHLSVTGNPSTTEDHHLQISSPTPPGRIESLDDMELPDNFLVTQTMQIPLSYAEDIIGIAGTNIALVCLYSGATVTLQESRGLPDEMIVEIKGTTTEVQTAQQLIQEFMGGGKEPAVSSYDSSYGGYETSLRSSHTQLSNTSYPSSLT